MLETNRENNEENKFNKDYININSQLTDKLLLEESNNKKEDKNSIALITKNGNEETNFTEQEEDEFYSSNQNIKIMPTIELKETNNINNNLSKNKTIKSEPKDKIQTYNKKKDNNLAKIDVDNKNNNTIVGNQSFSISEINRESLQNIISENNKKIDKKIVEHKNKINLSKIRIPLLIIEILLGILLIFSSFVIVYIFIKDNITERKLISIIVEPIILVISIIGIIPNKGSNYKRIIIALYLWEGLFLFPFMFYAHSGIKDESLYDICKKVLIARIFILSFQFLNFILSLILKLNI